MLKVWFHTTIFSGGNVENGIVVGSYGTHMHTSNFIVLTNQDGKISEPEAGDFIKSLQSKV